MIIKWLKKFFGFDEYGLSQGVYYKSVKYDVIESTFVVKVYSGFSQNILYTSVYCSL